MNQQDHAGAFRAAIEAAMGELDFICQESERLRNRMYLFDIVVEVLKPLMRLRRANRCRRSSSRVGID